MKISLNAWWLLAALLALVFVPSVHAARLALVIGNNSYRQIEPLNNAINDAKLIASTLKEAGFEVEQVHDTLDRKAMLRALNGFKARITKADEVVFFYAGHGVQIGQQSPVLLPIDITQESTDQIVQDGVQLSTVQDALKTAKFALLVIDACRINPFPPKGDGTRGMGRQTGLMLPQPADGSMVIMSAASGQKALDYVPGGTRANGLFTHEFVQVIKTPGLILNMAVLDVRDRVEALAQRAGNPQRPASQDESGGRFVFFAAPAQVATPVVTRPSVRLATEQEIEQDLWNVIRDSRDALDFEDYLKANPAGRFRQLAQRQLRVLKAASVQVASIRPEPVVPIKDIVLGSVSAPLPTPQPPPQQLSQAARPPEQASNASAALKFKPRLYLLAVGVSQYQHTEIIKLTTPARDAVDFAAAWRAQKGKLYREVEVKVLTDEKATRDNVIDGMEWLQKQVTQHDVGMVFLSGYGVFDPSAGYSYLPVNATPDNLRHTSVAMDEFKATLSTLPSKVMLFLDACPGDGLGGRTRGSNAMAGMFNPKGDNVLVVFSSRTNRQRCNWESSSGNGAFSQAVIEGLKGGADYSRKGSITVKELDLFVSDRVKALTNGEQSTVTQFPGGCQTFRWRSCELMRWALWTNLGTSIAVSVV